MECYQWKENIIKKNRILKNVLPIDPTKKNKTYLLQQI